MTNLRNRPLSTTNVDSMKDFILSMYHNLITGSKSFPVIPFKGSLRTVQMVKLPEQTEPKENTPSPVPLMPAGVMVPPATLSSSPPTMKTPVLPERTAIAVLKADRRNCVCSVEFDGRNFVRVISTVYRSESTELTNRWRVTDYSTDGQVLMSVLCQFSRDSAVCAKTSVQRKRKHRQEESSLPAPKRSLRVWLDDLWSHTFVYSVYTVGTSQAHRSAFVVRLEWWCNHMMKSEAQITQNIAAT